jgi:hypothetical protein
MEHPMAQTATAAARAFTVHGVEEAPSRGRRVAAPSFEAAALIFLETHHPPDFAEVSLLVEDCETGERQCFRVDLASGATAPCD